MKLTEKIYDVTTGEETIIERDATPQEIQERANADAQIQAEEAAAQVKAEARAAIATRLGLSSEELATLLG